MNVENQCQCSSANKAGANSPLQALWRRLKGRSGHTCNDLLSSNRVFQHLNLDDRRDLGLQIVPLRQIVGSSGRHLAFDLAFRPRGGKSERWMRVARAARNQLPPVNLYKVGDAYFVEDGNHRVSVARANGRETIAAYVVEINAAGLQPEPSCSRLGYRI